GPVHHGRSRIDDRPAPHGHNRCGGPGSGSLLICPDRTVSWFVVCDNPSVGTAWEFSRTEALRRLSAIVIPASSNDVAPVGGTARGWAGMPSVPRRMTSRLPFKLTPLTLVLGTTDDQSFSWYWRWHRRYCCSASGIKRRWSSVVIA